MIDPTAVVSRYHFTVLPTYDDTVLLLYDHSVYVSKPDTPVYDIVMPGMDTASRVNAVAEGITAVNSLLLNRSYTGGSPSLATLADGIYIIDFKMRPYSAYLKRVYHLRTVMITQLLDDQYAMMEKDQSHPSHKKNYDLLFQAEGLLRGAEALCRLGNTESASEMYQEAWRLTEGVNNQFKKALV